MTAIRNNRHRRASNILFVLYVLIGVAYLLEIHNPHVMGVLHIAAGVAYLL
jgi:hypothetical protein